MSIYEDQQRPYIKRCISVQREIYSEGKRLSTLQVFVLILSIVFVSYAAYFYDGSMGITKDGVRAVAGLFNVICIFIIQSLSDKSCEKQGEAASLQQYIDAHLYSDVIGNNVKEWQYVKNKTDIDEILGRYPQCDGSAIDTWYEDYSAYNPYVQVAKCQMENVFWDDYLRGYYLWFLTIVLVAILTVMAGICLINHIDIVAVFLIISGVLPLIKFYWSVYRKIQKDRKRLSKLKEQSNRLLQCMLDSKVKNKNYVSALIVLQEGIFENRKSCFLIPDWFHFHFLDKIHEKIQCREKISKEI